MELRVPALIHRADVVLELLPGAVTADEVFDAASDRSVSQHTEWSAHRTSQDSAQFLSWCAHEVQSGRGAHYAVRQRQGSFAGVAALVSRDRADKSAEATTWLRRSAWGTGLAHHARDVILEIAFAHLGLRVVRYRVATDNLRALHSLRRLAPVFRGVDRRGLVIDGATRPCIVLEVTATAWVPTR